MKKKRILLFGPMPPPSGGVSVHLLRLLEASKNSSLELAVFDIRKMKLHFINKTSSNLFSMTGGFFRSDLIHIHLSHFIKLFIAILGRIFFKKVILTIHNPRMENQWSTKMTIKLAYKTIFVFDPGNLPVNGIIIPAFIHPNSTHQFPGNLQLELKDYKHLLLSLSSASGRINNRNDIYGFDIILEAIKKINLPKETALILIDTNGNLKSKYESLIIEIEKEKNIRIIYLKDEINFPDLLSKCSMFIRATRSDGDSIAVREALSKGVTVLASDCVIRPSGCILFRDGDSTDLSKKIMEHLFNPKNLKIDQTDFSEVILELYRNV